MSFKTVSGKELSPIALGCDSLPFKKDKGAEEVLEGMISLGINCFDTARGYARSEEAIGKFLRSGKVKREDVFVISKGCLPRLFSRLKKRCLVADLDTSLKTLGTYIDLYLLHRDDQRADLVSIFSVLNQYRKEGKILRYGVSNWRKERIEEAMRICREHGFAPIEAVSNNFTPTVWEKDPWGGGDGCVSVSGNPEEIQFYRNTKMPLFSYSPLGRGFLTGRVKSGEKETYSVLDRSAKRAYLSKRNLETLKRIEEVAKKRSSTVAETSLAYIVSSGMAVYPVIGSTNPKRMKQNLDALKRPLSAEEVAYIDGRSL